VVIIKKFKDKTNFTPPQTLPFLFPSPSGESVRRTDEVEGLGEALITI